jgi:putative membrane protein
MRNVFAGLVAAGLFCSVTLGQEPQRVNPATRPGQAQPGQPGQPGQPAQQGQTASADQQIAACVYGHCHNEIEIAKFAESKAKNDDVREFAQRMVREHTPGCEELKRIAGSLATSESTARSTPGGSVDWVSIHKQIGKQCLESVKKELSAKQSVEFDECFVGQQIGAHMHMVDALKVLRNQVSSDLQQKLDKELQLAQQHLQAAKQLGETLKNSSERVTRRPENK